jgi:aspartate 1-decarboxylase
MQIQILKSKLHHAVVTETELEYVGSITIDRDLMDAAGLYKNEKVHVLNMNSGDRFETYILEGERGKGEICINGAAARLAQKGDRVIIVAYGLVDDQEANNYEPKVITLNDKNKPL